MFTSMLISMHRTDEVSVQRLSSPMHRHVHRPERGAHSDEKVPVIFRIDDKKKHDLSWISVQVNRLRLLMKTTTMDIQESDGDLRISPGLASKAETSQVSPHFVIVQE